MKCAECDKLGTIPWTIDRKQVWLCRGHSDKKAGVKEYKCYHCKEKFKRIQVHQVKLARLVVYMCHKCASDRLTLIENLDTEVRCVVTIDGKEKVFHRKGAHKSVSSALNTFIRKLVDSTYLKDKH